MTHTHILLAPGHHQGRANAILSAAAGASHPKVVVGINFLKKFVLSFFKKKTKQNK
jgi:hypothetical protein